MFDRSGTDRPIFIVGCQGSGTTLLQFMLDSHPRIALPPETRVLIQAHRNRRGFGDMRKPANRRRLAEWVVGMPRAQFSDLGIDAATYVERALQGPGSLGSVVGLVYQMYAERYGKPRWGDRRSSYIRHIDALMQLFPDAQIIHLIRDGRDCVALLKEAPWFHGDVYQAAQRWAEAIDFGRRAQRRLSAGSYHELHYEQLIADTEGTLTRLCAFIGEEYHPSMSEPRVVAGHADEESIGDAAGPGSPGGWERLEPWELALCETVLRGRLLRHDYQLTGVPKTGREHVAEYERAANFWHRRWRREAMTERLNRFREPGPVAALLTSGQRALAGVPAQAKPPRSGSTHDKP